MHITQVRPNPSLHPTCCGWLRQPGPAGELQRYADTDDEAIGIRNAGGDSCRIECLVRMTSKRCGLSQAQPAPFWQEIGLLYRRQRGM